MSRLALRTGLVVASIVVVAIGRPVAQAADEFDVASVRLAPLRTSGELSDLLPSPIRILPGDRFETRRWLRSIVAFAYGFDRPWDRIKGGGPILDDIFAVSARGAAGSFAAASADGLQPVRHMVQRLLTERFKLEAHLEQEERQVLLLKRDSPTKLGPALRLLPDGCAGPRPASPVFPEDIAPPNSKLPRCGWSMPGPTLTATGLTFSDFVREISVSMEREVVDETGLGGVYAFEITFDKDTLLRSLVRSPVYRAGQLSELPSFATALKSDLGLVLEPATRRVPVLVITHIEPLIEN